MSSAVFIPLIPSAAALVRARKVSFLARCQRLTAFQEAERVRAMADELLKTDPDLAQELYAAADRHEYAHAAWA